MPETKHPLTPRALLELKVPHSPHLSPDGRRVAFVVVEPDFEESRWASYLWLADAAEGHARRVTFSYEGEHSPLWSPDGAWIAFLSTRPDMTEPPPIDEHEEEERAHKDQVWILPADGGEAQRLTNAREGIRAYQWAPDGKTVIYLCPEARPQPLQFVRDDARKRKVDAVVEHGDKLRMQLWEVGVEEKRPELLYTGDYGMAEFDISPDGERIVFNSNVSGEANDYYAYDLHVLDIESGETRRLVERGGGKFQPAWSPDGSQIGFLANLDPELSYSQECVWTVPAAGGEPRNLFAGVPCDAQHMAYAADGSLYALVADRTNGPLLRVTMDGAQPVTPAGEPLECTDFDVPFRTTAEGPLPVVAVIEDAQTPPELYALDPGGTRRALTELNKQFVEQYALPAQEVVRWHTDIGEIEGVVTYPVGFGPEAPGERHPMVVMVHGGPKGHTVNTLRGYHLHPAWAANGYLVLRPNFRGSEGYGSAFAVANRRDLGGGDFRDVMAGVDLLVERGLADPARLGITGGSYGGYMTNWAIGHTDRFAAAVSMFGIFHLTTDFSNSEISRWDRDYMGAYYWEDPDIYRRCSPGAYLEQIRTPVLIIHGESDNNTFIANSREMYQALRTRGATVEFVRYPREGHGLREPNHKLDEIRRCLAWFDRYLKGGGHAPPAWRVGDKVEHDGYVLVVTRAEDAEYAGRHEEQPRLLEVAFSIASADPVEAAWRFALDDVRLTGKDETACPLRGVPVDAGGGRILVEGSSLEAEVAPDRDTGRVALALAAAFEIPDEGGVFDLRVHDFPIVRVPVGPKEEKPGDENEPGREGEAEAGTPPATGEEPPPQTPERPQTGSTR